MGMEIGDRTFFIRTFLVLLGSIIWLTASLAVAYPDEIFTFDISSLVKKYTKNGILSINVTLPILLLIDTFIIAWFIRLPFQDFEIAIKSRAGILFTALCFIIYLVIGCLCFYNDADDPILRDFAAWFVIASMLCLLAVRFLTYHYRAI